MPGHRTLLNISIFAKPVSEKKIPISKTLLPEDEMQFITKLINSVQLQWISL